MVSGPGYAPAAGMNIKIYLLKKINSISNVVILTEREGLGMNIAVKIHIKNHCIETEARNEYSRLMDSYFSTDDVEGELDERIELLRDFLEKSDFPKLRSSDGRLSGERESDVVITRSPQGSITLDVY
jgi:hypothetical protein